MSSSVTSTASEMASTKPGLLVQVLSYNTNLQGDLGTPQDLVDWLVPALATSNEAMSWTSPDIVAVGFQELLPLHLGLTGLTTAVLANRDVLIRSQIEAHAKDRATYSLVGKVCNVGVALLVYAKDDGVAKSICEVQTQWTGCGPGYMGNKGAVAVRFRSKPDEGPGEVFTFVSAHLTAHAKYLRQRIKDWTRITRNLLFPLPPPSPSKDARTTMTPSEYPSHTTIYHTSHLFVFGDLNFRLALPKTVSRDDLVLKLATEDGRKQVAEWDELSREKNAGTILQGLHEAEFWRFPCTYKHIIGSHHEYSLKRMPAWTDRVLFASHTDSSTKSAIETLQYASIPSYTTSDHKPITALLRVPPPSSSPLQPSSSSSSSTISLLHSQQLTPLLQISSTPLCTPSRFWLITRSTGKSLDLFIGWMWYFLRMIGVGHAGFGVGNFVLGLGALAWWRAFPAVAARV